MPRARWSRSARGPLALVGLSVALLGQTLIALLIPSRALASPPIAFDPYTDYSIPGSIIEVAVADVNGDHIPDVIATTGDSDPPQADDFELIVLPGNGDGTLGAPITYDTLGSSTATLAVSDMNGDGLADVVVGEANGFDVFYQGPGGLQAPVLVVTPNPPYTLAIGDIDGDGRPDVVIGSSNGVSWIPNETGQFGTATLITPVHVVSFALGDVTGDGRADVVGAQENEPFISVWAQPARGQFTETDYPEVSDLMIGFGGVAIADFNGDGRNDVAAASWSNAASLDIFQQNASGQLAPAVTTDAGEVPEPLVAADLNLDNRPDLVTLNDGWRKGGWFQDSSGVVGPETTFPLPYVRAFDLMGSAAAADLNGDGWPDLVIAGDVDAGVVVLLQQPPASSLAVDASSYEPMVGENVMVSGHLRFGDGADPSDTDVHVTEHLPDGTTIPLPDQTTDSDGAYSMTGPTFVVPGAYSLVASWDGDGTHPAATDTVNVTVDPAVRVTVDPPTVVSGGSAVATVHLGPYVSTDVKNVSLWAQPVVGRRYEVGSGDVDSQGNLQLNVIAPMNTDLTAAWDGDGAYGPASSLTTRVFAAVKVTGSLVGGKMQGSYHVYTWNASCVNSGTKCPQFSDHVSPPHGGKCMYLRVQQLVSGFWINLSSSGCYPLDEHSSQMAPYMYRDASMVGLSLRIHAEFHGDADHAAANSPWSYLKLTL